MSRLCHALCAASAIVIAMPAAVVAQSTTTTPLPEIIVEGQRPRPATRSSGPSSAAPAAPIVTPTSASAATGSLTIPTAEQAQKEIQQTPGAVEIVPAAAYRNTPATTVKDVLDYVPGVWAQPKWGEDTRLSIRGSGLSRNFHLRGIQLYMDGIPINTADGYGDFQEIDPSAYRYVEVYKGANALRFGANSLGGAINFVTRSGRDASPIEGSADVGSFGFRRLQAASGMLVGPFDYFVTGSWQAQDGFRDHSAGHSMRGSANVGYKLSPHVETRFYFNGNTIEQQIPGSVTKTMALTSPRIAAAINATNDWQRNINSNRIANKTTMQFDATTVEFGGFVVNRHLMHPIFQWLDYHYDDYGGFARIVDDRSVWGNRNRLIAGVNILNGAIDNQQFANNPGAVKGPLLSSSIDKSKNRSVYIENSFYFLPAVAFVAGAQHLYAVRDRADRFLTDGNQSGRTSFNIWSPKVGLLWDVGADWQVFGNISRSAEAPSFGESSSFPAPVIPFTSIKAQTATTYEIGTRGRRTDFNWDVALYRAEIKNELQCLYSSFGNCNVVNAGRTLHQGVEAGFGLAVLKSIFVPGPAPDTLWINAAYTLNDFRFDNDPAFGNNRLAGAPRHYFRGEILYKHPTGFFAGPNVEWVPEAYFVDSANTFTTEPYAIWGLKAGYDDGKNFSAYVEGRNLANKAYIASASVIDRYTPNLPLFEPGNGRGVYAGIRARW